MAHCIEPLHDAAHESDYSEHGLRSAVLLRRGTVTIGITSHRPLRAMADTLDSASCLIAISRGTRPRCSQSPQTCGSYALR
jgi:hypothetical protein